jgi:hypothetical protein
MGTVQACVAFVFWSHNFGEDQLIFACLGGAVGGFMGIPTGLIAYYAVLKSKVSVRQAVIIVLASLFSGCLAALVLAAFSAFLTPVLTLLIAWKVNNATNLCDRRNRVGLLLWATSLLTILGVGLLYLFGYVGASSARIEREHGLKLPSSARSFVCRGDAWMHDFSDSGAASAFEMASLGLPAFISQLKVQKVTDGYDFFPIFPSNSQYPIHRPWMSSGTPLKTYHCASPTGDSLDVQIWRIDEAHVGVLLYTDWN